MKLLNSFFSIKEQTNGAGGIIFKVELDKEHFIYKAHFPENPITPGVCIIQMAQELMELVTGKELVLDTVANVKYIQVISPVEDPVVFYEFGAPSLADEVCKCKVTVKGEGKLFTKLSLIYNVI